MSELQQNVIAITAKRVKPGSATADILCLLNGLTVHRDRIMPAKSNVRRRFIDASIAAIGDQAVVNRQMLEAELLAAADRLAEDESTDTTVPASGVNSSEEVSVNKILRPELIIGKHFSAIAIPRLCDRNGERSSEWLHLQVINGERQCVLLTDNVEVPDDGEYWLAPIPPPPTAADVAKLSRWSLTSRDEWLSGTPSPTTAEVLRMVMNRIDRYTVLPSDHAAGHCLTLAAWVMMTYTYPALPAVPYVYLSGPPASGKTRTMEVLSRMVFRPAMTANITGPTLYRTREMYGGVFLLDEAERMQETNSADMLALKSILLAGYKPDGEAMRMEAQGDTFVTKSYNCYGPIVLGAGARAPRRYDTVGRVGIGEPRFRTVDPAATDRR